MRVVVHGRQRRRSRAAGRFSRTQITAYGDISQCPQTRGAGRMLLALVLLSIIVLLILGMLLAVPGHGEVRAWVHLVAHSLELDRIGMLPPAAAR